MLLFALALQVSVDTPQRFSILAPQPGDVAAPSCERPAGRDILVCAPVPAQPLPTPDGSGPARPVNPEMTGRGALAAEPTPCAARTGGCQVGVNLIGAGVSLIRGVQSLVAPRSCCEQPGEAQDPLALVRDVGRVVRGRKAHPERVPIPLDDTPPATSRVLP